MPYAPYKSVGGRMFYHLPHSVSRPADPWASNSWKTRGVGRAAPPGKMLAVYN